MGKQDPEKFANTKWQELTEENIDKCKVTSTDLNLRVVE